VILRQPEVREKRRRERKTWRPKARAPCSPTALITVALGNPTSRHFVRPAGICSSNKSLMAGDVTIPPVAAALGRVVRHTQSVRGHRAVEAEARVSTDRSATVTSEPRGRRIAMRLLPGCAALRVSSAMATVAGSESARVGAEKKGPLMRQEHLAMLDG